LSLALGFTVELEPRCDEIFLFKSNLLFNAYYVFIYPFNYYILSVLNFYVYLLLGVNDFIVE